MFNLFSSFTELNKLPYIIFNYKYFVFIQKPYKIVIKYIQLPSTGSGTIKKMHGRASLVVSWSCCLVVLLSCCLLQKHEICNTHYEHKCLSLQIELKYITP